LYVTTKQTATSAVVNLASSIVYQPLSGVVKSYTYGNGLAELNTFNFDGELDTLTMKNGAVNVINRTHQRTDGQNITGIIDNMTAGNSATFAAENAGKLQNADGPWGSRTFYAACPGEHAQRAKAGDGVGNRVTELATISGVSTNDAYSYPVGSNRLPTFRISPPHPPISLSHSSSVSTFTPSSWALASLEPASSPATT
jgi:hypothetical protein